MNDLCVFPASASPPAAVAELAHQVDADGGAALCAFQEPIGHLFGGKIRQVMVYLDREKLQTKGIMLDDVPNAINSTNQVLPTGDAKIRPYHWYTYSNVKFPCQTMIEVR